MSSLREKFYYQYLGLPLRLKKTIDEGKGTPVVLLHGIGRTGQVWEHVINGLSYFSCRIVAYDLLGFGGSPKPDWINYDIDDHANAVIKSLERLKGGPAILVGHSMGCLISVRVAKLRPDLVQHLVLFEMPLYEGLPQKRLYRLRLEIYARFYRWLINYQPDFTPNNAKRAQRLATQVVGLEVNRSTWTPFVRSLEHTIMNQSQVAEDIKTLNMPMDIIYGTYDMMVIKGHRTITFGNIGDSVAVHKVRARHEISLKASRLIVQRITAALAHPVKGLT